MFERLLVADLVIADISIHNANVFYELGIRHALRGRQTFLLRARLTLKYRSTLKLTDTFPTTPRNPGAALPALIEALKQTGSSNRVDSPVFRSLPKLTEPKQPALNPAPVEFVSDVELAGSRHQGGKLGLLAWEAGQFLWGAGGLRVAGRCQFKGGFFASARQTWEKVRTYYESDLEANTLLGTIYHRLSDLALSDQRLEAVLTNDRASSAERAEALALRARNEKTRGRNSWTAKDLAGRRCSTLQSPFLLQSRNLYAEAYEHDLNHYYSGLNALSLSVLLCELVGQERDIWISNFDSEVEARRAEEEISSSRSRLVLLVESAMNAAERRKVDLDWLPMSRADYRFLTAAKDSAAVTAYERALPTASELQICAAAAQLEMFRDVGVFTERAKACLEVFPARRVEAETLRHVILFTGHRIDVTGRATARFPATSEPSVRDRIRREISRLTTERPGRALGVAGGANGGDILFHEVCSEFEIPTRVLLTLPQDAFAAESVDSGGPEWRRRFDRLIDSHKGENEMQVLGTTKELPTWIRQPGAYDIWQRTNRWILEEALATAAEHITLLAVWDGNASDGPGGTEDLVALARKHGITTVIIDPARVV